MADLSGCLAVNLSIEGKQWPVVMNIRKFGKHPWKMGQELGAQSELRWPDSPWGVEAEGLTVEQESSG